MNFRSIVFLGAIAAAITVGLVGCDTTGNSATVHVSLAADGMATVDGKQIDSAALPKKLKSLGIAPTTCIEVSIDKNTPPPRLAEVTKSLASEGFQKIIFVKPRHVEATRRQ